MAVFGTMIMTNAGQSLYTKIQAGAPVNFTKMQIGSGQPTSGQDIQSFTALVTPKHDIPIKSIVPNTLQKIAQISGSISNINISSPEYICEIGLWAADPDLGEILYAYASAGNKGDYFSPASQGAFTWDYQINAAVGNASSVTANISSLSYDDGLISSDSTLAIVKGGNQKAINKSIDNILKPYITTHVDNAYSVTIPNLTTLVDGYPLCIKFDAASTGAITVNPNSLGAKAVLDYFGNPVTTVRQNLIANLRYESTSNSFILLGKGGGGNAVNNDVRKNKSYTSDAGGNLLGTLDLSLLTTGNLRAGVTIDGVTGKPSVVDTADATAAAAHIRSGQSGYVNGVKINGNLTVQSTVAQTVTPTTSDIVKGAGIYDGALTIKGDANLISSNIPVGKNIFDVPGSLVIQDVFAAGDNLLCSSDAYVTTSNTSYTKMKEIKVNRPGVVRVKFCLSTSSSGAYYSYGQLYKNGVAVSSEYSATNSLTTTATTDISVNSGDLIQVYAKKGTVEAQVYNFRIYVADSPYTVNT